MNTSIVSTTCRQDASRSTPARPDVPVAPDHSEDITVVRPPRARGLKSPSSAMFSGFKHLLAGAMLVSATACGTTSGDRVVSGAGIGAGAGAVLGAVTGMGPGTGAAIGAAAGAATGGLTKKKQVNLGKPLWR